MASSSGPLLRPLLRLLGYARPYLGRVALVLVFALLYASGLNGRVYLVQPLLSNHPELEELSRGALSTVRVMTARNERGEHEVLSATVRIAVGNRVVDNFHRGGVGSAVNLATGELGPAIGIDVATDWLEIHPLTGTRIRGRALPGWAGVLEAALRAHDAMPGLVFAGWDVAMTPTGPTVIEGNSEPCVNFLQRSHGEPLGDTRFGELLAHHLRAIDAARGLPDRPRGVPLLRP